MNYPPAIHTSLAALPRDPDERHEFLVDVFGQYLFWALEEAVKQSKTLVESSDARGKLGRVFQKPYLDAASKLDSEQRSVALNLARETVGRFAKLLLAILQAEGISHRLGEDHAIRFRLIMEICEIQNMAVVLEEVINRGGKKPIGNYWGRWLNQTANNTV